MINSNIRDIVNSVPVFEQIVEHEINGKIAFKIARLVRELDKELKLFHEERTKIIQRYAKRDENNKIITENENVMIDEDQIENCNKEIQDLLNTEVEINADKIPIDVLETLSISPQQILLIDSFLSE